MMEPEKISKIEMMKINAAMVKGRIQQKWIQRQRKRGMWYCAYCDKMHGKRVVEYNISNDRCVDSICSLAIPVWIIDSEGDSNEKALTEHDFYKFIAGKPCGRIGE